MKLAIVGSVEEIIPDSGRAVLVEGHQVAIFRITTPQGEKLFGIDNFNSDCRIMSPDKGN